MRIRNYLFFTGLLFLSIRAISQPTGDNLLLNTDRDLYFVGENLMFHVINPAVNSGFLSENEILEVTLFSKAGDPIVFQKLIPKAGEISNRLFLPDTLTSGIFILEAQIRDLVASRFVQVVNPYKKPAERVDAISSKSKIARSGGDDVSIVLAKEATANRDRIEGEVKITGDLPIVEGTLSATKKYFLRPWLNDKSIVEVKTRQNQDIQYSIRLEGALRNAKTKEPYDDTEVRAHFAGRQAHMLRGFTDEKGYFQLKGPLVDLGKRDIVFQAPALDSLVEFELIQQSPDKQTFADVPSFYLAQNDALDSAFFNWQVSLSFRNQLAELQLNPSRGDSLADFYGKPYARIYRKDYIRLKNITELFKEVGYGVKVRGKEGEERLVIVEESSDLSKRNPPLVLFNGYPLADEREILNLPLNLLEYFDVIREDYYLGNNRYGGLLNVVAIDATLNLNIAKNAFRTVEKLTEPIYTFNPITYDGLNDTSVPNLGPTLLWERLTLEGDVPASFEFTSGDDIGIWILTFRGVTPQGEIIEVNREIEIINNEP